MKIEDYGHGYESMNFQFTNTKFNQSSSISGTFIDFAGNIHGNKSQTILIMGGDDKGAYSVNDQEAGSFFMTQSQRKTITKILKGLSSFTDDATISSNNGTLHEMCVAIYRNYIG